MIGLKIGAAVIAIISSIFMAVFAAEREKPENKDGEPPYNAAWVMGLWFLVIAATIFLAST